MNTSVGKALFLEILVISSKSHSLANTTRSTPSLFQYSIAFELVVECCVLKCTSSFGATLFAVLTTVKDAQIIACTPTLSSCFK